MNDADCMLMVFNEEGVEFLAAGIKEGFMGGPWPWKLPFEMLANFHNMWETVTPTERKCEQVL